MRTRMRFFVPLAMLASGLLTTALASTSASASTVPATAGSAGAGAAARADGSVTQYFPMTAVGVDRKVAAAHGFTVVTDSQGHEHSVPASPSAAAAGGTPVTAPTGAPAAGTAVKAAAAAPAVTPYNTLPGDCGTSYVKVTPVGNHKAVIQTGFTVNAHAVSFDWTVHVVDDYGVSNKHWSNVLPVWLTNWVGTNNFTSSGPGWVYVNVSSGFAVLWNGTICYSHGPWDQALIY